MEDLIKKSKLISMIIYDINSLENLESYAGLTQSNLDYTRSKYENDQLKELYLAIEYAAKNPGYDFQSIIPTYPKHTNDDIYKCLCKLDASLKSLGIKN